MKMIGGVVDAQVAVLLLLRCTSAGVDVLRPRGLTNQKILIEPGAFLCHNY